MLALLRAPLLGGPSSASLRTVRGGSRGVRPESPAADVVTGTVTPARVGGERGTARGGACSAGVPRAPAGAEGALARGARHGRHARHGAQRWRSAASRPACGSCCCACGGAAAPAAAPASAGRVASWSGGGVQWRHRHALPLARYASSTRLYSRSALACRLSKRYARSTLCSASSSSSRLSRLRAGGRAGGDGAGGVAAAGGARGAGSVGGPGGAGGPAGGPGGRGGDHGVPLTPPTAPRRAAPPPCPTLSPARLLAATREAGGGAGRPRPEGEAHLEGRGLGCVLGSGSVIRVRVRVRVRARARARARVGAPRGVTGGGTLVLPRHLAQPRQATQ